MNLPLSTALYQISILFFPPTANPHTTQAVEYHRQQRTQPDKGILVYMM